MTDAPRRKSRFWLFAPIVVVLALFGAYSAYWVYLRGQLDQGIDQWIATQRAAGLDVAFEDKRLGGYPYRVALDVDAPAIRDPETGLAWRGERLQLVMQPWNLRHVVGRAPGVSEITTAAGEALAVELGPKSVASLSWTDEGVRRVSLALDRAELRRAYLPPASLSGVEFHARPAYGRRDDLQILLQWDEIELAQAPEGYEWLGGALQPSRLAMEVTHAFPALASDYGLSTWTRLEGRVEVAQLLVNWGPVKFGLKVDVGLNRCLVLNGVLSARM